MKGQNNVFRDNRESVHTVKFPWGNKTVQRAVGLKQITPSVFVGYITCNKTITARWSWDVRRFELPVIRSLIAKKENGESKRFVKTPLNLAIKELVLESMKATA